MTFCLVAPASQAGLLDWTLRGPSGFVMSGKPLTLYNLTDKESLKYGSRTWGINLVWTKSVYLGNVQIFHRGSATPILYGERVAIYIKGGGYLKHEKRTVGINLGWSSKPVYEWKIGGTGGPEGTRLRVNDKFCLLNTVARDCVIYDNRKVGINLVWAKDEGKMSWTGLLREAGSAVGNAGPDLVKWLTSGTEG